MKGIYGAVVLCCLLLATSLFAADVDDAYRFHKLDNKINRQLKSDQWNYVSRTFVRILWDDYKMAHENIEPELSATSIYGKVPDIQDYGQYVGVFKRDKKKTAKAFLEIKKSDKGTFFVELAGYSYPAIAINKSIVFTTGKITTSSTLPRLAQKPYCMLMFFSIARIDGKYFFLSPDKPPSKWLEIFKDMDKETG